MRKSGVFECSPFVKGKRTVEMEDYFEQYLLCAAFFVV